MLAAIEFYCLLSVIEKNAQQRLHLYLKNIANILAFYEFFFYAKCFLTIPGCVLSSVENRHSL